MRDGNGEGETERGATGRGRLGGGNEDGETGRGNEEGEMVRGRPGGGTQRGVGQQVGETGRGQRQWGEEGAREGISQMDMMECLGGHRL